MIFIFSIKILHFWRTLQVYNPTRFQSKLLYFLSYFWNVSNHTFSLSFFFLSFMAAPMAYGSSQTRDGIRATAVIYTTAMATPDHLTHWARPGIEPMPSTGTWATTARFLTHCTTAGTPLTILLIPNLVLQLSILPDRIQSMQLKSKGFLSVLRLKSHNL